MSGLSVDCLFIEALRGDAALMDTIGDRLYDTAIPMPDEDAANAPVPYVIVSLEGVANTAETKDDGTEGLYDTATVRVKVAAQSREALAGLAETCRCAIRRYVETAQENADTPIQDYSFSAEGVQYDAMKPCHWQDLTYHCETLNTYDYE